MACADITPLLVALPQGLLEAETERERVEGHVAECSDCTHFLAGVQATLALKQERSAASDEEARPVVRISCSVCKDRLRQAQAVFCAACLAPGHEICFREHGRCPALGCEEARVVRPQPLGGPVAQPTPLRKDALDWRRPLAVFGFAAGAAALVALALTPSQKIVVRPQSPQVVVQPRIEVPAPVVQVLRPDRARTEAAAVPRVTPAFPAVEPVPVIPPQGGVVTIDLLQGEVIGSHPAVSVLNEPRDTDDNGSYEAVLKLDMEQYREVEFEAFYGGEPSGMTINLGDSRTNNGFAGDGATQSNDAEVQVHNQDLSAWGNDDSPADQRQVADLKGVVQEGARLRLVAMDGAFSWQLVEPQAESILIETTGSPYLFALNGQPDREGPTNADLFLGLNRDISYGHRRGAGLTRVTLRFTPR